MFSHPLFIASIPPTLFMLGILGFLLLRSAREERPFLALLMLIEWPMHFVSSYGVRKPLNHFLDSVLPPTELPSMILRSFQAPLVEESFKLVLIFLAYFLSRLNTQNAIRTGMIVGASFGLSEVWSLAYLFAQDPAAAGHPWYHYLAFVQERTMVAPIHGVFAVAAAVGIARGGRSIAVGVLTGMGLHYLANFPILLAKLDIGHLGKNVWGVVLALYISLYTVAMYVLLIYYVYGKAVLRKLMSGIARCPECNATYQRPRTRVNVGPFLSYEKCTQCNKSHWIRLKDLQDPPGQSAPAAAS